MGKIKKILENELIGGTQSTDVYPVTSVKAVYDGNNERLDNILKNKPTYNDIDGYRFHKSGVVSYEKIPLKTIPNGNIIINSSAFAVSVYSDLQGNNGRQDIISGNSAVALSDIVLVRPSVVPDGTGELDLFITKQELSVTTEKIVNSSVTTEKIDNKAVRPEKLSFAESKNLINTQDPDYKVEYFVNSSNQLLANPNYDTTGFIPVEAGKEYTYSIDGVVRSYIRTIMYYDINKIPINNDFLEYATIPLTIPEGASFTRFSIDTGTNSQFEKGNTATAYEPYSIKIPSSYLDFSEIEDKISNIPTFEDIDGHIFRKSGVTAYQNISISPKIPMGTVVINNSAFKVLIFSDSTLANRQDIPSGAGVVTLSDIGLIRPVEAGEINLLISNDSVSVITEKIANYAVTTQKIKDKAVTMEKLSFAESKNLVDENDPDYRIGYYINNKGQLLSNSQYTTTGFIPVESGKNYTMSNNGVNVRPRMAQFFNGYKELSVYMDNPLSTITVPDEAAYVRVTKYNTQDKFQFEKGNTATAYEPYELVIPTEVPNGSVVTEKIDNGAVTTDKISDNAVTADKMFSDMWSKSDNLYDDRSVIKGEYLNTANGKINNNPNPSYETSDFIEVFPDTLYFFGNDGVPSTARFICEYNSQKEYLNIYTEIKNTYRVSENCAFIRVTMDNAVKNQVNKDYLKPYSRFFVINSEFIPLKEEGNKPLYFHLPKNIYVPVGLTVEMYYKQMLLDAEDYYISTSGIGSNLKRKLQFKGVDGKVGEYELSVSCYDKNENTVAQQQSKVHIVSSSIPRAIKVLPIGDSITNNKPWLARLNTLSPNITTVGTRGSDKFHEGRSGANCVYYLTGDKSYSFDVNYIGAGSDSEMFNEQTQYHSGDYCKYTVNLVVSSSPRDVDCVFMFTEDHLGAWDESKVVNMTTRNPFWNPFTNKFSINWYKEVQNIDFDVICIWLGTNGINLTPETNNNGALGIKTLVDYIRAEDTTTPIIIVNTFFRCSQNGIGKQGNTDGYKPSAEYKHNADKKVLLLENAVDKLLGSYENLYVSPVAATFDSEYNFLNPEICKVQVNPYFTNKDTVFELMEYDSVHPFNYNQAADQIFGTLSYIINK